MCTSIADETITLPAMIIVELRSEGIISGFISIFKARVPQYDSNLSAL